MPIDDDCSNLKFLRKFNAGKVFSLCYVKFLFILHKVNYLNLNYKIPHLFLYFRVEYSCPLEN